MLPFLAARRSRGVSGEVFMESPETATLYARCAHETRAQATLMVNASVRSVMEQLAVTWDKMAERELVRHVLSDVQGRGARGTTRRTGAIEEATGETMAAQAKTVGKAKGTTGQLKGRASSGGVRKTPPEAGPPTMAEAAG
jgi:hypothetical protein